MRVFPLLPTWLAAMSFALAQVPPPASRPLTRNVESGLEQAAAWKWRAVPSEGPVWGESLPSSAPRPAATPLPELSSADAQPQAVYEVKKGDALAVIARRFGLAVVHLKKFNHLENDLIRIGQTLNIPTPEQARAIAPLPADIQKAKKSAADNTEALVLQIFLDREGFSPGPITGQPNATLSRVAELYRSVHADAATPEALLQKAREAVGREPFDQYTLREEDFAFIVPPKARRSEPGEEAGSGARSNPVYEALVSAPMLGYHGPWEFIAERFHCDAVFLRSINPEITTVLRPGSTVRVPRVAPFAIESALRPPLQPAPDPARPVTATVVDLTLLLIRHGDQLVAVAPISSARPGLRGRGTWTILNAIPRPRLETRQEPTAAPTPVPRLFGADAGKPEPTPTPLPEPQFLAAGPNNPAGILWINLAKSDSPEPLRYGLHGTSIPAEMNQLDSIGGFRMTNWDIARVVRMLPNGTPLKWTQFEMPSRPAAPAMPAAPPAP